jgi:putative addiction module component (TIGR02574 family)
MNKALRDQVMRLPPTERAELAQDLWDSLADHAFPSPTPEQLEEIDRRIEEHRRDPGSAIPYEEVVERLKSRIIK